MGRFPPTVAERVFARAVALAATSEGPTDEAIESLVDLAGDHPQAIEQALARHAEAVDEGLKRLVLDDDQKTV